MNKTLVQCCILLIIVISVTVYAKDTDLYTANSVTVPPNVLIIFDNSGSMEDGIPVSRTYDPLHDYTSEIPSSYRKDYNGYTITKDTVYKQLGGRWNGVQSDGDNIITDLRANWGRFPGGSAVDKSSIDCSDAKTALNSKGMWTGYIGTTSPYSCGSTSKYTLATGNYLCFFYSATTAKQQKIQVAKTTIKGLLTTLHDGGTNIRVGLMVFDTSSNYRGGHLLVEVSDLIDNSSNTQLNLLKTKVDSISAQTNTPLAETLAEAGLYFAGKKTWAANSGYTVGMTSSIYNSPIKYRCQQNYVIIMTDGNSTQDKGDGNSTYMGYSSYNIFTKSYINSKTIFTYWDTGVWDFGYRDIDHDNQDPGTDALNGTHWLDDVAKFIHDEDLRYTDDNDLTGETFGKYNRATNTRYPADPVGFTRQSVSTYTIGFATGSDDTLLKRTADADHGCGMYRTSNNANDLQQAFSDIFGSIIEKNVNLSAPVVPVSQLNQNYSGRSLFLGMFRPVKGPFWYGNIKKYGLTNTGEPLQKDGLTLAIDDTGVLKSDATSCYQYSNADGPTVNNGGVGGVVNDQANNGTRRFYTYDEDSALSLYLTDASNLFITTNDSVKSKLGGDVADPVDLINFLRADGSYKPNSTDPTKRRSWILGDFLHSRPYIQSVRGSATGEKIMLVGSNDGFLHCFVDVDNNNDEGVVRTYSDDTVSEAWCFVPWELIPKLKYLQDPNQPHQIFVDGSPTVYKSGSDMLVTFGLRRGGSSYYTLKVGNADNDGYYTGGYDAPEWRWKIDENVLGTGVETLGQSWCTPKVGKIKDGGSLKTVMFLSGGYDPIEDSEFYNAAATPAKTEASTTSPDTKGRAVFAVDTSNNQVITNIKFYSNKLASMPMPYCITDLLAYDSDADVNNLVDTIYAGDLGGNVFVFNDRAQTGGTWLNYHLFQARHATPGTETKWIKFMYKPVVKKMAWGDYVFIGSGDREAPGDRNTYNYFYAIKNKWDGATINQSELKDVSSVTYDDTLRNEIKSNTWKGWYFKFPRAGEKVVSSPILYEYTSGGQSHTWVIFTTFTPDAPSSDACNAEVFGVARDYRVDYETGEPVCDFDNDGTVGGSTSTSVDADRSRQMGRGMPSQAQIVYLLQEDGTIVARELVTSANYVGNSQSLASNFLKDDVLPPSDTPPPDDPNNPPSGPPSTPAVIIRYWKQD